LASRDDPDAFPEQRLAQERAVAYRYCFGSSRQSTSTGAFAAFQVSGLSLHCLAWIADRALNDRPSDRLRSRIIAELNEVSCIAQREHCREAWSRKIAIVRWLADEASSVPRSLRAAADFHIVETVRLGFTEKWLAPRVKLNAWYTLVTRQMLDGCGNGSLLGAN
jgi:hypothetical protein